MVIRKSVFVVAALISAGLGFYLSLSLQSDFETLQGEKSSWRKQQGQWLVVNYFAEWCAPCLKEIPELNIFDIYAKQRNDLRLIGVSFDPLDSTQLSALVHKYDIDFDVLLTEPQNAPYDRPRTLPATFIISPQGELIKQLQGEQTAQGLISIMQQLTN